MIPVSGAAMRSGGWEKFVNEHRTRNITLISGDAMANQLDFLDRNFAQGLVGQLPYEMGAQSIQTLQNILNGLTIQDQIVGTNVLSHVLIPLKLPEHVVDHNLIGNLHVVGYILFGILLLMTYLAAYWTYRYRKHAVVTSAQPTFLAMILLGVVLMSTSMIPLSFDDDGKADEGDNIEGVFYCMSTPWLGFCGFTLSFSALFSKTMRVNRIFHSQGSFRRRQVTKREVILPFAALMTANLCILVLWSVLDPLRYERHDLAGTDGWNRVIATYGSCRSKDANHYLIPLAVINLGALVLANWEAYCARNIMIEFSEAKYIGLAMMSLMQACGMGIPVLFVIRESPQAYYLVLVFMIFVTCTAVLALIFVPKIVLAIEYNNRSQQQLARWVEDSLVAESSQRKICSSSKGSSVSVRHRYSAAVVLSEQDSSTSKFLAEPALPTARTFDVERCQNKSVSVAASAPPLQKQDSNCSGRSKKVSWSSAVEQDSGQSQGNVSDHDIQSIAEQSVGSGGRAISENQAMSIASEDETTIDGTTTLSVVSDSENTFKSSFVSLQSSGINLRSPGMSVRSSATSRSSASQSSCRSQIDCLREERTEHPDNFDLPSLLSFTERDEDWITEFSEATQEVADKAPEEDLEVEQSIKGS